MTANSEPVGPQQICFKGPPSRFGVNGGVIYGSLKAQLPSSGLQRRFRNSKTEPSGVIDAILPHFDHAIVLAWVSGFGRGHVSRETYWQHPLPRSSSTLWMSSFEGGGLEGSDKAAPSPKRSSISMSSSIISGIFFQEAGVEMLDDRTLR